METRILTNAKLDMVREIDNKFDSLCDSLESLIDREINQDRKSELRKIKARISTYRHSLRRLYS